MVMVDMRIIGNPDPSNGRFIGICAIVASRQYPDEVVVGDPAAAIRWTMPTNLLEEARGRLLQGLMTLPDPEGSGPG